MKVFYFLLVFALLVIGNSAFVARFSFQEQFQMLKDISLGAMSVVSSLLAVLATANFLPKDLEDRTVYSILAKPVPRTSYLLGKYLGIVFLLGLSIALMAAVFLGVLWLRERSVVVETMAQMDAASPEELARSLKEVTDATFNRNLAPGIAIIFVKSALLAALTLLISSFATSGIFSILMASAVYFIGHLQSTLRDYFLSGGGSGWLVRAVAGVAALLFPDLQAFNFTDDIIAGAAIPAGVFLQVLALGGMYIAAYVALAAFVFSGREL